MISTRPVACSTAPSVIGTSSAPAGIRRRRPSTAPTPAIASVSTTGSHGGSIGPLPWSTFPAAWPSISRATTDALSTTMMTRRYCMNATSRGSAPYSSAIAIIAEAAPGEEPQAAVVPGSTANRVSPQPTSPPATIVVATVSSISGQSATTVATIEPVIACATRQPISACAAKKNGRGTRTVAPRRASTTPVSIGPSRNAAGNPASASSEATASDTASSTAHCPGGRSRLNRPSRRHP